MKRDEWYWLIVWVGLLVMVGLKMFAPGTLPERVEMLSYLVVAIVCGRNLAAAARVLDPEKGSGEERGWNKFWMYWGILGLVLVFLCFVFYMETSYVLMLWLLISAIITGLAWRAAQSGSSFMK